MDSSVGELAGLTAVVTGSSSGIGSAIVRAFAAAGAHCLIHARANRAGAEGVADEVRKTGVDATVRCCDLANAESHAELVKNAWDWRGTVDIWVNNAGADVLTGEAASWDFARKLDVLHRVDVVATIALSRAVGERMLKRGAGVILNIGWDQAEHGMAGDSGQLFAASKGAIMAFTRSLARTLAPQVRVNCIAPGWIKTNWGEEASDYWQQRARQESLLGRWGKPDDVAQAARFLASPAAAFITAQTVAVNGGLRQS